jgi:hypothetical protein
MWRRADWHSECNLFARSASEDGDAFRYNRLVSSPLRAVVAALVCLIALSANPDRDSAQVLTSPAASLDVRVPAAPTPVRIGGRVHLVYELHITNFRAVDLTLTRVEVFDAEPNGRILVSYQNESLAGSLARAGTRSQAFDTRVIAGGGRAILFVWLALDDAAPQPSALRHRISFTLAGSGESGLTDAGRVELSHDVPPALGAPLRGGPWVAVYSPSSTGGHRRALFAVNGTARIPARFAIDWIKLGEDGRTSHDDSSNMANHYGYGADVLAVADGTIVDAVDRFAEPTTPITMDNEGGNYVTLDLGHDCFAFYEHLKPGSVRVRVGDRVRAGQLIGLLGGSGSVFGGPHLHFHVSNANSPLGAEGIPYVFRQFEQLGAFASLDDFAAGGAWVRLSNARSQNRRSELPAGQAVVRF